MKIMYLLLLINAALNKQGLAVSLQEVESLAKKKPVGIFSNE